MSKNFIVILVLVVLGFVGLVLFAGGDDTTSKTSANGQESQSVVVEDRYLTKSETATLTLREFSDFECPACVAFYPVLSEVKTEYEGRVNVAFRHFPLTSIHPKALAAHRIAEAAHNQDVFSDVHDLLYEQNQVWVSSANPSETIYELIESANLGVDIEQLKADAASNEVNDIVNAHIESGRERNVNSTPSFFLGDERIQPNSVEQFREILDEALAEAEPAEAS